MFLLEIILIFPLVDVQNKGKSIVRLSINYTKYYNFYTYTVELICNSQTQTTGCFENWNSSKTILHYYFGPSIVLPNGSQINQSMGYENFSIFKNNGGKTELNK